MSFADARAAGLRRCFFEVVKGAAKAAATYHRARIDGLAQLPPGAVLLVGNHGLYGYETPVFFYKLYEGTRRVPVGLADRGFFKLPLVREVLPWVGGVPGTRENALRLLRRGELVVCYPGGAAEVFKHRHERYLLKWHQTVGFVRVAAEAGVPIVPFAARGIDETFFAWGGRAWVGQLFDTRRYAAPLPLGVGPLPVRFRFALGEPLAPPSAQAPEAELVAFREHLASRVRAMLERLRDA